MDWMDAQKELSSSLVPMYGEREAAVIADWVMESLSGKKKLDRMVMRGVDIPVRELEVYQRYRSELLAHRPVQYVLGESWFAGMRFFVDERVLIPRPETEELVDWVVESVSGVGIEGRPAEGGSVGSVLDVGTGSGCIAVTLARRLAGVSVFACDVSVGALAVAQENAERLGAPVGFLQLDFLDRGSWNRLPPVRWVVSNPPYIAAAERKEMARHVVDYEPSTALFVPDTDDLVFYRALGEFARERIAAGGGLFVEIHENRGAAVSSLLSELGAASVVVGKDLQGKDRMIKATW